MRVPSAVRAGQEASARPLSVSAMISVGVFLAIALLFRASLQAIGVSWWQDDAYGHGLLLGALSAWILWRDRAALAHSAGKPQPAFAFITAGLLGAWALAEVLAIRSLMQTLPWPTLLAVTGALHGREVARLAAFPLLLPLLASPLWDMLLGPLQQITALLAGVLLKATSIPVFVDRVHITIPAGQFLVEEACAGLRYFLAGLSIAVLYGYWYLQEPVRRIVFAVVAGLWTVLLNGVRVAVVVILADAWGMHHPWVQDHGDLGWVIFALGMVPLLAIGRLLERTHHPDSVSPEETHEVGPNTAARAPVLDRFGMSAAAIALSLLMVAALQWRAVGAVPTSGAIDLPGASCTMDALDQAGWRPRFVGADQQRCAFGADGVVLYSARYDQETQGSELVYFQNQLHGDARAGQEVDLGIVTIGGGEPFRMLRVTLGDGRVRYTAYRYQVGPFFTARELGAKLLKVPALLAGASDSAVLAASTVAGDEAEAQVIARLASRLDEFERSPVAGAAQAAEREG